MLEAKNLELAGCYHQEPMSYPALLAWCQKQGKRGLQIYECPYCGGWHLTSHPWEDAR